MCIWLLRTDEMQKLIHQFVLIFLISQFNISIILFGNRLDRVQVLQQSRHYTWWCNVHRPWLCQWCGTFYARLRKVAGRDLKRFDEASTTMGLHTSWEKTKLQNIGHGPPPQSVSVGGHPVAVTDQFVHLGSTVDSTGYSSTDILRRVESCIFSDGSARPSLASFEWRFT